MNWIYQKIQVPQRLERIKKSLLSFSYAVHEKISVIRVIRGQKIICGLLKKSL
jgi:hypothetical protein